MRLLDKIAVVTGGSRGIGRAVALAFAREGARVAVAGAHDPAALARVVDEITAHGEDAFALTADVSQRAQVDRMVQQVLERWGRIDVLVNNAGIIHPTRLEEIGETQWQETLAVHLTGTFHGIQSVVPVM